MQKTTVFGMLGACALALSNVPGLPPWVVATAHAVSAMCVAMLGYHAQDCPKDCPNRKPSAGATLSVLFCIAGLCLLSGCKVGGLGLDVKSPAFGSVGLSLDGGVIGHGVAPTNVPSLPRTNN